MQTFTIWNKVPGECYETPIVTYYPAKNKTSDGAFVIFPGGGFALRADHEGAGYAEFLNNYGIDCFVVDYRIAPHKFPLTLLDARRAVQWVRSNAAKFNISPDKIIVMGSSAGGQVCTWLSTDVDINYDFERDEVDDFDFVPNYQVLAYPTIVLSDERYMSKVQTDARDLIFIGDWDFKKYDPMLHPVSNMPGTFLWHTSEDPAVFVSGSMLYGKLLAQNNVPFEMHIFPFGNHGLGLAEANPHVSQWGGLLVNWLKVNSIL